MTAERPGRLEIEVDCPAPQLLVVAESYHRGWRATVDGEPQDVYRVNGDFMGCLVEPGKHRVVLDFQPDSLERGWLASCLGLACCPFVFSALRPGRSRSRWRTICHDRPLLEVRIDRRAKQTL